ncbi:MAG: leucyl aminopeptidase family protein [Hyphomicrobiaceae bacterium]|nr:leucyl aminopeptidase family protein [Hyphomicrobiaceae bacterium]
MTDIRSSSRLTDAAYVPAGASGPSRPIWLVRPSDLATGAGPAGLGSRERGWLEAIGFKATARRHALVPAADGGLGGAVLGLGEPADRPPYEPAEILVGLLPSVLPAGDWHLAGEFGDMGLAALAWGLGAYRFRNYKSGRSDPQPRLLMPAAIARDAVLARAAAVALGRDLINTPSNDMGPAELEAAARSLAVEHRAEVNSIVGDDLRTANFPLIHAVGRASPRLPRLVDIRAGRPDAPKVTIVGKGICFDTGGLDIKPSSAMLLMKKDMGGAAAALALAHMILALRLDVRLRVLLPMAENSVAGNAFRPGDVITSRAGRTVEIGNTDAEGRLVLADALTLADEEAPEHLYTFATLTGAARVALGPEIVPFYTSDTPLAASLAAAGESIADPLWRMPLATPYDGWLDSPVADMNNVSEGGFAGSIVGAIFLKRFVTRARRFVHFDIYGWRPQPKPLGPKGGEPQAARAVLEVLRQSYPARNTG